MPLPRVHASKIGAQPPLNFTRHALRAHFRPAGLLRVPQACHLFPAGESTIPKAGFDTYEVHPDCVEVNCDAGLGRFGSIQRDTRYADKFLRLDKPFVFSKLGCASACSTHGQCGLFSFNNRNLVSAPARGAVGIRTRSELPALASLAAAEP